MTRAPQPSADHYSYSVYADPAMAESFEARRFGGPIGQLIAREQEQVIAGFLDPCQGRTILDVGTGTGRAAIALAKRAAIVTGVDASGEMLKIARQRAESANAAVAFEQGDAHDLPFADRSFDAVVCLRVLMHTPDWRRCLAELCRAARTHVVFDYPALVSAAAVQALARRITLAAGRSVEAYRVFSDRSIRDVLQINGFRPAAAHRQFVLPIALHKTVNSATATERVEGALAGIGLRRLLGSPVTILAERCES